MGLMDLSTSVASKKHVDFNDARYQLADKLRQNGRQSVRSTFTLYDSKEPKKMAIKDISTAYALSDKRLPIGELLNKMVDLIVDMEDGVLETEKDASYAWKYSAVLLSMYDDKKQRRESLAVFDNGLKNAVINSQLFIDRYPGRYTNRTNFFDAKIKASLESDVIETFKEIAIPQIHEIAIKQSRARAEKHSNLIMDQIVQWAVTNYGCKAEAFFEVKEDENTKLFYSINTVILHLKNGYDMSIVGHVGTDHDDKFSISLLDALNISMERHDEKISQDELQKVLIEASNNAPIDPLVKLYELEKQKNKILQQCHQILTETRPMIPAEVLEIEAAESVVGKDYIWGCQQFRTTHEALPVDFKLEDIVLPEFSEEVAREEYDAMLLNSIVAQSQDDEPEIEPKPDAQQDVTDISEQRQPHNLPLEGDMFGEDIGGEYASNEWDANRNLRNRYFGGGNFNNEKMPNLPSNAPKGQQLHDEYSHYEKFDASMTLLPGVSVEQAQKKEAVPSVTKDAQPVPVTEAPTIMWKDAKDGGEKAPAEKPEGEQKPEMKQPTLLIDDLDSLFA